MRGIFLLTISLLALFTAQWWMAGRDDGAVFRGELHDSDSYMRLVRVTKLLQDGAWHDQRIDRANAPHGHTLHWSRPLDGLLVAGAAILTPSLGGAEALHQAGVWLPSILHVLTLLALLWAARPLLGRLGLLWLGLLFPLQLLLDYQFAPGRPDHHALILLLFVSALGAQIRAVAGRPLLWAAILALPLGLLVWVSVEGLVAVALAFGVFLFRWFRQGRTGAFQGLILAAGLAVISVVAIAVESPSADYLNIVYDKISIVYTALFLLIMSAFAVAALTGPRWPGIIAFAAVPALSLLAFPPLIHGPLAGQDRVFAAAILQYAGETASANTVRDFLLYFGPAFLALPFGLWRLRQTGNQWPWALLTAGMVLYLPLAILAIAQIRWAPYVALLALPGYCAVLTSTLRGMGGKPGLIRIFAASAGRTAVVLAFAFGWLLLSAQFAAENRNEPRAHAKCPQDAMARHLAARFAKPRRILSYMTIGPAILYRSQHEVIATPYFRNAQGGRDTLEFFRAMDVKSAFEIADRRRIDLVLTCPADRESRLYRPNRPRPVWLQPLQLPSELAQWYRLYKVLL